MAGKRLAHTENSRHMLVTHSKKANWPEILDAAFFIIPRTNMYHKMIQF